mgnify:CR=1 FL=1
MTYQHQIKEASKITGLSVRTLRYYHEIGLVVPQVGENGYRYYGEKDLLRLQQIVFFRELNFSLADIQAILERSRQDMDSVFAAQKELLLEKRQNIDAALSTIDAILKARKKGEAYSMKEHFQPMTKQEIEAFEAQYKEEVDEKYCPDTVAESRKKAKGYSDADWAKIQIEAREVYQAFTDAMPEGPSSEKAADCVKAWQAHITKYYYPCTDEILSGLGQMYVADERFQQNIDQNGAGLAQFMSDAIAAYTANSLK